MQRRLPVPVLQRSQVPFPAPAIKRPPFAATVAPTVASTIARGMRRELGWRLVEAARTARRLR